MGMYHPESDPVEKLNPTMSASMGSTLVVSRSKEIRLACPNSLTRSSRPFLDRIVLYCFSVSDILGFKTDFDSGVNCLINAWNSNSVNFSTHASRSISRFSNSVTAHVRSTSVRIVTNSLLNLAFSTPSFNPL